MRTDRATMTLPSEPIKATLPRDLTAGLVVFLVALPLCLGVALASNAPLFSGVLAGIVGGIVVGLLSGSQTSVSGPAAGLTAVVAAQIAALESFPAFLSALMIAGVIQATLGLARAGSLAAFFPTSVIKGLLAAIGAILVLKQVPHVLGHDPDPEGDMAFRQLDQENTFSELIRLLADIHPGAAVIGLGSVGLLVFWDRCNPLKKSPIPAPLVVVLLGVAAGRLFRRIGGPWPIEVSHLVQVPVADSFTGFLGFLQLPDFAQWSNPAIYGAALTIAAVASLETLLNLEAVDKIDPKQRTSPPSRELLAQGVGNVLTGLLGGLPVTSVIVRSSVNINAGAQTKLAAMVHGVLLLVSVLFLPTWLNLIPLSCLAAILLVTGMKLANPTLVRRMWSEGRYQFIPFAVTMVAIVLTDLLIGILIGLAVSVGFILNSNLRRPVSRFVEKHLGGEVVHIELANQVSFLNRASLSRALDDVPRGGHLLLNARNTDYIDPDILDLVRDFTLQTGPARKITVSLLGFRKKYQLRDQIHYVDYSTRELQTALTPSAVLQILQNGHERFRSGRRLTRLLTRQVSATAERQHPLAVILSCIDSRAPAELIFDLGVGDVLNVRIAGNVISPEVLGSIEYGCALAGSRLIVVMGHTRCGAVTAAIDLLCPTESNDLAAQCEHLGPIVNEVQQAVHPRTCQEIVLLSGHDRIALINEVARRNVVRTARTLVQRSQTLNRLVREGRVGVVGAMYDVASGEIDFLIDDGATLDGVLAVSQEA